MKVNIVCRNAHNSDRILPRLALELSRLTGWAVRDDPDDEVDLNYYFPYLEFLTAKANNQTLTAAWFTHHDTMQKGKSPLWDQVAQKVDLRTVSASMYLSKLEKFGLTEVVIPPLDQDKFVITPQIKHNLPVIGTSGFVYPGGRKGEHLISMLSNNVHSLGIDVRAIGAGWPIKNVRTIVWDKMAKWYQGLDIYLCASMIEGVGYGPLEALACGKQVVIPSRVGVFDDLPDVKGIWRYQAGDYDSMVSAIESAVEMISRVNPIGLRDSVAEYIPDNWAKSHIVAFDKLINPAPTKIAVSDVSDRCGVYYVAFGRPSRVMAKKAISSFKKHMPGIEVMLVSADPLNVGEDHFCYQEDKDIGGRIAKINVNRLAPNHWEYILYLDADTQIIADISFLYQVLVDGWELVICKNPGKYHEIAQMLRLDNADETEYTFKVLGGNCFLQLNGGVFGYRRTDNTARFFELWLQEWDRWGKRDQAALHRALYLNPLKTYVLGNEWNTIIRYDKQGGYVYDTPDMSAGILHFPTTARRWKGLIDGRLDSEVAWDAVKLYK